MFSVYRSDSAMFPVRQTWEQADDPLRAAILRASQALDHALAEAPHEKGESRPDGTRILFAAPLAVLFLVDEKRKLVSIVKAWTYRSSADERGRAA